MTTECTRIPGVVGSAPRCSHERAYVAASPRAPRSFVDPRSSWSAPSRPSTISIGSPRASVQLSALFAALFTALLVVGLVLPAHAQPVADPGPGDELLVDGESQQGVGRGTPLPLALVDRPSARTGETVGVRGTGWSPGDLVVLATCGNRGARGSVDCDQPKSVSVPVNRKGELSAPLTISAPPVPCPCVVLFTSTQKPISTSVFLAIPDGPGGALPDPATAGQAMRKLRFTASAVEGGSPMALLGAPSSRQLVVTVRNEGILPVTDAPMTLAGGVGDQPTDVVSAPALGSLAPGEERVYRVPVEVPALAFGSRTYRGELVGFDEPVVFTTTVATTPWLLVLVLFGGAAMAVAVVVRRRTGTGNGVPPSRPTRPGPPPGPSVVARTDESAPAVLFAD